MYLSQTLFDRDISNLGHAGRLAAVIGLERLCLGLTIDALAALEQAALYLFDPNIGDQWCEVRASLVLEIDEEIGGATPGRFQELRRALACQAAALERLQDNWLQSTSGTDRDHHHFRKDLKCRPLKLLAAAGMQSIAVTPGQKYLVLSYFLKRYYSLYRNPAKLEALAVAHHQSTKGIEAIIRNARRHINKVTDKYLESVSRRIADVAAGDDRLPIPQRQRYGDYGILCGRAMVHDGLFKRAVYPGMKVLLAELWTRNVPILLNVKVVLSDHCHTALRRLYLTDAKMPFAFRYIGRIEQCDSAWLDRHAFVVEAVSDPLAILPSPIGAVRLTEILDGMRSVPHADGDMMLRLGATLDRLGLDRLLSLNTARHPQFLKDELEPDYDALDDGGTSMRRELQDLRDQAERIGCCMDNMATLRVYHMLADRLGAVATRSQSTVWVWGK